MGTISFIHISDVMLGINPDVGCDWSEERQQEIYSTFENIITDANDRMVDLILISGNLFDHIPSERELEWLDDKLSVLKTAKVVYATGDRDYQGWDVPVSSYNFRSNIFVMGRTDMNLDVRGNDVERTSAATMAVDCLWFHDKNVRVYGISCFGKKTTAVEVDGILSDDATVDIMVVYEDVSCRKPVNISGIKDSFSYVALGGSYRYRAVADNACYSGSPEPVSSESTGRHGYIYGEISHNNVSLQMIPVARREYKTIDYRVDNDSGNYQVESDISRLLSLEGSNNIYTINLVRADGCEKNFDLSGSFVGYRVKSLNGAHFDRTDYSKYISANRSGAFGRLLKDMENSDVGDLDGYQKAVDEIIDMSGLYRRGNKHLGKDAYNEARRQVLSLFHIQKSVYENDADIRAYNEVNRKYQESSDVLEELNQAWAHERSLGLQLRTLKNRAAAMEKQYRQARLRKYVRAVLIPVIITGAIVVTIIPAMIHRYGISSGNRGLIGLITLTVLITVMLYYSCSAIYGRRRYKRGVSREELDAGLSDIDRDIQELDREMSDVHTRRVELQQKDNIRRNMWDILTSKERELAGKRYEYSIIEKAISILEKYSE